MDNPLIDIIFELLLEQTEPLKIHEISQRVKPLQQTVLAEDNNLHLYRLNFLIMNALYQLQQQLIGEYTLNISALQIELIANPATTLDHELSAASSDNLRRFYLDWHNYQASVDEVNALLTQFWQQFGQANQSAALTRQQALALFQLPQDASMQQIKQRWRKLALSSHPDRNAHPPESFQRYLAAWQVLKYKH
ncbi:DNA-J related domain-containing protein [Motilimonas sp. KMU-193]|uniref:DNA-J related domain-containing protein n=1 Tax=Motilimonas sp. KMU-193 TaxID=3388668 RepID=UPI00396B3F23